jgi:hypothetical protein
MLFTSNHPLPSLTAPLKNGIAAALREAGRVFVEHEYNRIDTPCRDDIPLRLRFAGAEYRRRPKCPNQVGTLFGAIELRRFL